MNYEAACLTFLFVCLLLLPSVRGHRRKHLRISGRRKEVREGEDCCKQGALLKIEERSWAVFTHYICRSTHTQSLSVYFSFTKQYSKSEKYRFSTTKCNVNILLVHGMGLPSVLQGVLWILLILLDVCIIVPSAKMNFL